MLDRYGVSIITALCALGLAGCAPDGAISHDGDDTVQRVAEDWEGEPPSVYCSGDKTGTTKYIEAGPVTATGYGEISACNGAEAKCRTQLGIKLDAAKSACERTTGNCWEESWGYQYSACTLVDTFEGFDPETGEYFYFEDWKVSCRKATKCCKPRKTLDASAAGEATPY